MCDKADDTNSNSVTNTRMGIRFALREHWPEYLIEGWALGCFMIAAALLVTLFESPKSPLLALIPIAGLRLVLLAIAIGITLTLLIQSPWGKRSGAHMNPAITLAFLRLKKIHPWDAMFFIFAQTVGGMLGVILVAVSAGKLFTDPPIRFAVTVPGSAGAAVAFAAETVISFALMTAILVFTGSSHLIRFTGIAIGCLVAFFIIVEAPLSGTSMNPARTLASAVPGMMWEHLWIYLLGPTLGMLAAAELYIHVNHNRRRRCAKLLHSADARCIHCGYRPPRNNAGEF